MMSETVDLDVLVLVSKLLKKEKENELKQLTADHEESG